MGRFLNINLCVSHLGGKTLRLFCKLRYLITILRTFPHLSKTPLALDFRSCSLHSSPLPPSFARKGAPKSLRFKHRSLTAEYLLGGGTRGVRCSQTARVYSTSSRDVLKAEAPIGVLHEDSLQEDSQTPFQLSMLCLGDSFNRLSRHINIYFKRKDVTQLSSVAGNVGFVVTTQESLGSRPQRRNQSNRAARERRASEDSETTTQQPLENENDLETSDSQTETSSAPQRYGGLQLFHISSIATRFGESYSYVAHHINSSHEHLKSVFTKGLTQDVLGSTLEDLASSRVSRRKTIKISYIESVKETEVAHLKTSAAVAQTTAIQKPAIESANISNNWEGEAEGYLHFAQHVNRYFGAKTVTDETELPPPQTEHLVADHMPNSRTYQQQCSKSSTSRHEQSPTGLKQEDPPIRPKSLFHISNITTSFGENYAYMANYVNSYFKGSYDAVEGEELERGPIEERRGEWEMEYGSVRVPKRKPAVSFMECLLNPSSAIPSLLGGYLGGSWAQSNQAQPASMLSEATLRRMVMGRRQAEELTRALVFSLQQAFSPEAITEVVDELNTHLIRHPGCKAVVWQEKAAVQLLRQRRSHREDQELQCVIRETLALIGYVDPVKGRGIRVLSIDGGGTRGVVPLQVLKQLEAETGKQVHQLFDYICGVSTGAVLAFMLGLARFSLEECADMYRRFGSDVFRQNPLVGTVKMGWSHSYYSTETWEMILREKMGDRVLIKTARDELSPKVSAVSAVVNWGTSPKAFIFRNYNHSPGRLSRYAGGSGYQMWQAVRASSAAPGYFQEFPLHSDIHQDGGLILNNPCALAVHESRLLWPNQPYQCVLSLGTGRYDNAKRSPGTSTSLRAKINHLICSATDTEGVHTLLDDLLAPDVYFRFNPMLSAEVSLDESSVRVMEQLQADTQLYLDRNKPKMARLCKVLGQERTALSHTKDWVSERAWEMQQSWV
ncbi:calcium-independent phospholipase A2-gamma isoform X1 [Salmo trutta]|uniref:Calcium-independent phospholipase A2-gamma-like n=1 Tax=Salmo trutta TaxID=8032 RepID=A0A674CLM1_SALTR|nr:calcium-independent phospholipase A2-gamma-like isoform X1 [Salmo trutta]